MFCVKFKKKNGFPLSEENDPKIDECHIWDDK